MPPNPNGQETPRGNAFLTGRATAEMGTAPGGQLHRANARCARSRFAAVVLLTATAPQSGWRLNACCLSDRQCAQGQRDRFGGAGARRRIG